MENTQQTQKTFGWLLTGLGALLLLGGFCLYAFGPAQLETESFSVEGGLAAVAVCSLGIGLIVCGVCGLFIKKTRQMEIEEKDERNVAIANAAKARGFEVMSFLFALSIAGLGITGRIGAEAFFILFAAFAAGQIVFIARLYSLQKRM